ncbi:hypothetical protein [Sphingomicrobium sediminis]|uniref:Uncharacterized protein n=1 Tax=Sphingomicrobium sediminis TaxID=2950949 RepID=A0A9X2J5J2_9SPHN|nr:hypothetical protein [Sphingomicrobium sediminis]MCM8558297.1 hypothetical protein [Sphingomicrobium sediminis]
MTFVRILSTIGIMMGMAWVGLFFMATSIGAKAPTSEEYLAIMWPGLVAIAAGFVAQWFASSRPNIAIAFGWVSALVAPLGFKVVI